MIKFLSVSLSFIGCVQRLETGSCSTLFSLADSCRIVKCESTLIPWFLGASFVKCKTPCSSRHHNHAVGSLSPRHFAHVTALLFILASAVYQTLVSVCPGNFVACKLSLHSRLPLIRYRERNVKSGNIVRLLDNRKMFQQFVTIGGFRTC